MKFGVAMFPADFAMRPDDLAVAVEERGLESLFFTEHTHVPRTSFTERLDPKFSHTIDLYVSLSFALSATSTLLVGSGVTLVPEHDPFNAAKALASLDVLSGGRLLVGVGTGWIPEELVDHGVDPDRRWGTTIDYLKAIRAIWANDEAEYHGRYVDFGPMWSWPKPLRPEGPPILVGGNGPRATQRALELGSEWFPEDAEWTDSERDPVAVLEERVAELRELAARQELHMIPVSLFGADIATAEADPNRLQRLSAAGVHRVVFYVPSATSEEVCTALDRIRALRDLHDGLS